jgi:purine-nucleoside phosphorylase
MLIADHINLMFRNPLIGPVESGEGRFPDMSDPYDPRLAEQVRLAAMELRIPVQEGVYAAVPGPSYETPAEIRMLDRLGADAVGMSTVPEVIAARASGIRCVAVSCLTNYAAGVSTEPLDHQEVLETGRRVAGDFQRLVTGSVQRIGALLEDAS